MIKSLLDDIQDTLSAFDKAEKLQKKAANVGFDWKKISPVIAKVDEEILELKDAIELDDPEQIKGELGDVFFSLVNLSRFLDINPEDALKMTISKFEYRFSQVEQILLKKGKTLENSSLEEMDKIWNEVKKSPRIRT